MKLLSVLSVLLLIGVVVAQDSAILPGWKTREPGYDLRVLAEGEGDETGPYVRINAERYERKAAELGMTCVQYEKLVWRKQHATFSDMALFRRHREQDYALYDQFNPPTTEAFGFNSFTIQTPNPVILGTWYFVTGGILEGDTKDTLYFIYEGCRAL